jgi:putative membrane protein insertion efficiency factor
VSWPGRALIALARFYQATLARFLGGQCRFQPTCSEYFIEAVQKKGAFRGLGKGLWRILRCHPFGKKGFDPVE